MVVIGNGGAFLGGANSYYGFTASNNASIGATPDVNISRNAAGILQVGTSARNASGTLIAAKLGANTSAPLAQLQVNGNITHTTLWLNPTWLSLVPTAMIASNNASTTAPNTSLTLFNDNQTAGAFTPFLIFGQRETDGSHSSATAAIGSRSVLGSGSSSSYIDGELMFYTSPTLGTPQGLAERMRITEAGSVCVGLTSGDAFLNVAGATTARASLNVTAGTYKTTPVAGDIDYNGTNIRHTNGANTAFLTRSLTNTATLDFGSIGSNSTAALTITVTGAATGDAVFLGAPSGLEADLTFSGYVSATNTVTVRLHNASGGSIDPASATWRATVIKF
jgi:hypothetical protein